MSLKTISQVFKRSVKIFNFNGLGKLCGVSHHQRMTGFCFYIYADRERERVCFKWQMPYFLHRIFHSNGSK